MRSGGRARLTYPYYRSGHFAISIGISVCAISVYEEGNLVFPLFWAPFVTVSAVT